MNRNNRKTSTDIAYQRILQKIIDEKMNPGTPLREEHLAEEFGLSPTPVREALRCLEFEGWVQNIPYKGCSLKVLSRQEISDLYLLRESIEFISIGEFIRHADAEERQELQQQQTDEIEFLDHIREGDELDNTRFLQLDLRFHQIILKGAHSPQLQRHHSSICAQLSCLYRAPSVEVSVVHFRDVHREHRMITDAIIKNWVTVAEDLIRNHISQGREHYLLSRQTP